MRLISVVLSVPFVLTPALSASTTISTAYESAALPLISNTINAFTYLVDMHEYRELTRVFTSDAVFVDSPNVYRGLDAIIAGLDPLANVSSQHGYTTQYTSLTSLTTANATAYLFSNFYGQDSKQGKIFTVYGRYDFTMTLVAAGWRAQRLTLTTLATTGDETIVYPKA